MRRIGRRMLLGCAAGAALMMAGGGAAVAETTLTLSSYSPTTAWSVMSALPS